MVDAIKNLGGDVDAHPRDTWFKDLKGDSELSA
jgi:hypothetical protein